MTILPFHPVTDPQTWDSALASLPNALIMETYPTVESRQNLALPLFPVKGGYVEDPRKPGLGIDPDPEMVKKYRVARTRAISPPRSGAG